MRAAFYDFDGTLAASNIVTPYWHFAARLPSRFEARLRQTLTVAGVPLWLASDAFSRRIFNELFYWQYRGLRREWLEEHAREVFEADGFRRIFAGSARLVEEDRADGYEPVLLTGGLDFVLRPAAERLGFGQLLANRLVFRDGVATGRLEHPTLASAGKRAAILEFCRRYNVAVTEARAYADSYSDAPLLAAVGEPAAVNPDRRLRRLATRRGWRILSTKEG